MTLALAGVRIVDLTQVMAGPFCTMLLGDLGADVIKVEPPGGDLSRSMGGRRFQMKGKDHAPFLALNRNIVLDLKRAADVGWLMSLLADADVLVESYRPGVAQRLGLGFPAVAARNERLIYASISGFGQSGPWADRPGFDLVAQGMSGVMSVMSVTGPTARDPGYACSCGSGLPSTQLGFLGEGTGTAGLEKFRPRLLPAAHKAHTTRRSGLVSGEETPLESTCRRSLRSAPGRTRTCG